jgi:ubiquitin-like protein Pup
VLEHSGAGIREVGLWLPVIRHGRAYNTVDPPREGGRGLPQEQKRTQKKSGGGGGDDAGQTTATEKGEKLKEEMDEILDEIDEVLEENAEEFIKSYVQKGGE